MKLRTFLARDMREALANVRSEMGDDAVIVASEKTKGGGIMVRAALDEPEAVERALTPDEPVTEIEKAIEAPASLEDSFRGDLMKRLRGAPQSAKTAASPFSRAQLLTVLRGHRLPDNLAHDFAKTAENSGLKDMTLALASALDRRMKKRRGKDSHRRQDRGACASLSPPRPVRRNRCRRGWRVGAPRSLRRSSAPKG